MTRTLLIAIALLAPALASAQTVAPFVYDGGTLATGKTDFAVQPTIPASQKIVAAEWNQAMQSVYDTRTALTGGLWHGFFVDQAPPAALDGGIAVFAMDGGAGVQPNLWYETPDTKLHQLGTGGWVTDYDCDYTAQPAQSNTATSGTATLCSQAFSYVLSETANHYADALAIVPDAGGLQIELNCTFGGSTGFGANNTVALASNLNPRATIALATLVPNLDQTTAIRVTARFGPNSATGSSDACYVGIDHGGTGSDFGVEAGQYFAVSAGNSQATAWNGTWGNAGLLGTDNTVIVTMPTGMSREFWGTQSVAWPSGTRPASTTWQARAFTDVQGGASQTSVANELPPSNWLLGFQGSCTFTHAFPCSLLHLTVEHR